jgi:hypothetical protein
LRRVAGTVVDSSVLLDVFTEDLKWLAWSQAELTADFLIGAHAAVTGRPLLTRDPRRVAAYILGTTLIAPPDQG